MSAEYLSAANQANVALLKSLGISDVYDIGSAVIRLEAGKFPQVEVVRHVRKVCEPSVELYVVRVANNVG